MKKPKKNDFRICLDPKDLNKAIKRPRFHLTKVDEALPKISRARIFSFMDVVMVFGR